MKQRQRTLAEHGVRLLEDAIKKDPPPGVNTEGVRTFFQQHRAQLTAELRQLLAQPNREQGAACGCRHSETTNGTGAQKS